MSPRARRASPLPALLLACIAGARGAAAHGGDDHSHAEPTAAQAAAAGRRTAEAVTEKYEAVMKFPAADAREVLAIDVYLTEYSTNAPVSNVNITLSFLDLALEVAAEPSARLPGLYEIRMSPGRSGTFQAIASVQAPHGADLLLFEGVTFGPEPDGPPAARAPVGRAWLALAAAVLLVVGMAAGWLARRRPAPAATVGALLLLLLPGGAAAHGGDDHGVGVKPAPAGPSARALVTKEAQLAFGIRTIVAAGVELPASRSLRGTVMARPDGKADVIAPQAGRVVALGGGIPRVGETVRAGQPLLAVEGFLSPQEQVQAQDALAEAEARAVAADQELAVADKQWARVVALPELVARRERDEAEARLETARAAAGGARRSLRILRASASGGRESAARYVLEAPIDGVVTSGGVTIGEGVEAGHRFFSILDTRALWIRVSVPESEPGLTALVPGAPAFVGVPGRPGVRIAAKLVGSSPSVDPGTRTVPSFFEADGSSGLLLEGQLVEVRVETGSAVRGFVVPAASIVDVSGRPVVFVHVRPEAFEPREVILGAASEGTVQVLSGLADGDRVAVSGTFQLRAALLAGT